MSQSSPLPCSPCGTLHVLPPEVRIMIYALTLKPRVIDFALEGRGAQLRVCPRSAASFTYLPVIAHVCAEMRAYIFGHEVGECRYTPITFEYHVLAASLGPDGFDIVERLVVSPSLAAAGVSADPPEGLCANNESNNDSDSYGDDMDIDTHHSDTGSSHSSEEDEDSHLDFFDDFSTPRKHLSTPSTPGKDYATLSSTATSITRGCVTCYAGSSRRVVRGVFSPKLDKVVIKPYRFSRLNLIFNPVAPDLVYVEKAPPIRLLSHRRTPLRSAFTKYLQGKADDFIQRCEDGIFTASTNSTTNGLDDQSGSGDNGMDEMGNDGVGPGQQEHEHITIVDDVRSTSGRYEIITVPNEVSILREIPWVQLPRGRFHQFRR